MAAPTTASTKNHSTLSVSKETASAVTTSLRHESDELPALTPPLLASYQTSHYRLLLWLCLGMAFILSIFPVNDPDIFFSLQVGKMVSAGEFPWGSDPFSFAQGDQSTWIHNGWLGDWVIYQLYELGGGPLLVLSRAILVTLLFWMLARLGRESALRFWTVLIIFLGVLAISQRLYFRTELFSLVLLGLLFSLLARVPRENCTLTFAHRWTAGRWYWLIPIMFLLWANIDGWFFVGLGTCVLWCLGYWLKPGDMSKADIRSLSMCTLLSVVACCATPYHVKSFLQIPARLSPPIAGELHTRFEESTKNYLKLKAIYDDQKRQVLENKLRPTELMELREKPRYPEQLRLLGTPFTSDYLQRNVGADSAENAGVMQYLTMFYPNGLSLSEWAFFPLFVLVLISLVYADSNQRCRNLLLLCLFVALGIWQSRLIGFFVVGGVAVAVLNIQSRRSGLPGMNRGAILGKQILCLVLGVVIQCLCLLHLIPTPDLSPLTLGYVHPRGAFGIAFRRDPLIEQACKTMGTWQQSKQSIGQPFHLNWTDMPGYDSWYNPGSRHFLDRRLELFDLAATKDFQSASDALIGVISDPVKKDGSNVNNMFERQDKWQDVFKRYQISHLVVTKRGQQRNEIVSRLLAERDRQNRPVWKPLQLHNGQVYALAWVGSPFWKALAALEFNAEKEAFQQERLPFSKPGIARERGSFTRFLYGDAIRRPAALDESIWHQQYEATNPDIMVANQFTGIEAIIRLSLQFSGRGANPLDTSPIIPMLLGGRQGSAAALLLSLEAVRRAVAEMTPETPAYLRADVYVQYADIVKLLSEYEARFTPLAPMFHAQQRLFLQRQAALACYDAMHPDAFIRNLELAKEYRLRGVLDIAMEHYQLAVSYLEQDLLVTTSERRKSEITTFLKNPDANTKMLLQDFSPVELQNLIKQQTEGWEQAVKEVGNKLSESERKDEPLYRASMAFQAGLPRKALDELQQSGVRSVDAALLASDIYSRLGQFDLVLVEFLDRLPDLRQRMGERRYQSSAALGEWCRGKPELAAQHCLELAKILNDSSLETSMNSGLVSLFGTSIQPVGNVFAGTVQEQQAASMATSIADQQISAGLMYLEAGKPKLAIELFTKALRETNPETPWRPLLERYYLQITGKVFEK